VFLRILIVLFLFSSSAFADEFNDIIAALKTGHLSRLNTAMEASRKVRMCNADIYGRTHWVSYSELLPGYYQGVVRLINCKMSSGEIEYSSATLKVLYKDSIVFYYALGYFIEGKDIDTAISILNTPLYSDLFELYKHTYGIVLDAEKLFAPSASVFSVDGIGYDGSYYVPQFLKMKSLINKRSVKEIYEWLSSPIMTDQLYALYGLKQLEKIGYALDPRTRRIMQLVAAKKGTVETAFGCMQQIMSIEEAIGYFIDKE
jgi:hypothetical protein